MTSSSFLSAINFSEGDAFSAVSTRLFWFEAGEEGCTFDINEQGGKVIFKLKCGEMGMFAVKRKKLVITAGSVRGVEANVVPMAKLQAFIDTGSQQEKKIRKQETLFSFSHYKCSEPMSRKKFEYWLISQCFKKYPGMDEIIQLIRDNESYWIVKYLLNHSDEYKSLREIGMRYGVSVSHFRRLSKFALGNTAKVEMCHWRLIRAILDIMGDEENFTAVAMKHGYASLSHFSGNVKSRFGIPPRDLKKMINSEILK